MFSKLASVLVSAVFIFTAAGVKPRERIGPGVNFKELEAENIAKWIKTESRNSSAPGVDFKDSIITMYGYSCGPCKKQYPNQEEAAGKVLKRTSNIQFGRIDVWSQHYKTVYKVAPYLFPNVTEEDVMNHPGKRSSQLYIPRTFWISGENNTNVAEVPQDIMEHENFKKLLQWIRNITNYQADFPPKKEKEEKQEPVEEVIDPNASGRDCGPQNLDNCNDEDKALIETLQAMSAEELQAAMKEVNEKTKEIEAKNQIMVDNSQAKIDAFQKLIDEKANFEESESKKLGLNILMKIYVGFKTKERDAEKKKKEEREANKKKKAEAKSGAKKGEAPKASRRKGKGKKAADAAADTAAPAAEETAADTAAPAAENTAAPAAEKTDSDTDYLRRALEKAKKHSSPEEL